MNEYKRLFTRRNFLTEEEKNKMEEIKEKLKQTVGLSRSDISMLEFESNTNMFKEFLGKLGDK